MKLAAFAFLADENIDDAVVRFLESQGFNVRRSKDVATPGSPDRDVLRVAHAQSRVVLTHDRDFGRLAIAEGEAFTGIVYLRPGHIRASFTIESIRTLLSRNVDVAPPFLIVVDRVRDQVTIRIRQSFP